MACVRLFGQSSPLQQIQRASFIKDIFVTFNQLITLALMQREHQRLEDQADQLRYEILNLHDLYLLRDHWLDHLGFQKYSPPLVAAMDRLIRQQENGNCSEQAYAEVIHQISAYRQYSRYQVACTYGNSAPYLLQGGRLHPVYEQSFKRRFEATRSLTVIEQADILQRLFPNTWLFYEPPRCLSLPEPEWSQ